MKFKIEIDMQDFIDDAVDDNGGDSFDINDELRGHVTRKVITHLLPKMQASIDKQITDRVDSIIEQRIKQTIDKALDDAVNNGVISQRGSKVNISDHVRNMFEQNTGWNNIGKQIEQLAKSFAEDMKVQYSAAFANKIVSNMKDQGLLKDDVVKILLNGKGE